ncbi:hypothetical protein BVRB_9g207380 [Beta vulgaris subsp. vulgaris]|nr:hypothetical protein BVRB_9g207380 [Beta vulgaris subsp. vulgaris]
MASRRDVITWTDYQLPVHLPSWLTNSWLFSLRQRLGQLWPRRSAGPWTTFLRPSSERHCGLSFWVNLKEQHIVLNLFLHNIGHSSLEIIQDSFQMTSHHWTVKILLDNRDPTPSSETSGSRGPVTRPRGGLSSSTVSSTRISKLLFRATLDE